jgi:hypothetical protein
MKRQGTFFNGLFVRAVGTIPTFLMIFVLSYSVSVGAEKLIVPNLVGPIQINNSFFGMHIRWGASTTPWPYTPIYSWRVITEETAWEGLEPRKGEWHFEKLDQAISQAEMHGTEVLLTLGYPPPWAAVDAEMARTNMGAAQSPKEMADWQNYIRTVAMRYKGRIKYYELMNEPLFTETDKGVLDKRYFPVAKMVEMARIAKSEIGQVDSNAKIVSMSPTGGINGIKRIDAFLSAGGGKYIDVVGFHYYADTAEDIPFLVAETRKVMKRHGLEKMPLWNTESGFYIFDPKTPSRKLAPEESPAYDLTQGAAMVSRSLILGAASGLDRNFYYSWDIPTMSLTSNKGEAINDAGLAYITTVRWLRMATLEGCQSENNRLWMCTLSRADRKARILWNTSGETNVKLPEEWHAVGYENITGLYVDLAAAKTLNVGSSPVLIRSEKLVWSAN